MKRANGLPKRLYKYRDLTARTSDMVVGDKLNFADPSTFNDPLDTRLSVEADVGNAELTMRREFALEIEPHAA